MAGDANSAAPWRACKFDICAPHANPDKGCD
jgi:hypothetical protein